MSKSFGEYKAKKYHQRNKAMLRLIKAHYFTTFADLISFYTISF